MSLEKRLSIAATTVLLAAGCAGEEAVPPLFNAIDRSVTCPAGQVGWDFSTGGFEDDVRNAVLSNELRIVEATYGGSCAVTPGNWTPRFAANCNGNVTCSRRVFEPTDPDPAPGCGKDFTVKYSCGVEDAVYQVKLPVEAGPSRVNLRCGDVITVTQASYGGNVNAANVGNLTAKVAGLCSGARRCTTPPGSTLFGGDPAPGRAKDTWVKYFCGNSRTPLEVSYVEGSPLDFECPIREAVPQRTVNIIEATYGLGVALGGARGNATDVMRSRCNGKGQCLVQVSETVTGDPAPGLSKPFWVDYTCGSALVNRYYVPPEAGQLPALAQCGDPIKIVSASYGPPGANNTQGNFTTRAQQACDGRNICQFENNRGVGLFGSDPAPGQVKRFAFTYLCGSDTAAKTVDYAENDLIRFYCPVPQQRATSSTGMRIVSATYGANCAQANQSAIKNNAIGPITQVCYGKDVCDYAFDGIGSDPVPNCAKHLSVEYRCGDEVETKTAKLEAQSGTLRITCAPTIKVSSARFGGSCGGAENNALSQVKGACHGKRGDCSFQVGALLGDNFPGCAKDFKATYTCGADPALKTITLPAEASFSSATFTCPTPTTPYVRKECVPERCQGRQRRDADLKCVADLTKPVIPEISGATLSAVSSATKANVSEYRENVPVDLNLLVTTWTPLDRARFPIGTEVSSATVWALDTYRPNGGGPEVQGFRCTLANVGLRVDGGGANWLVGKTTGTVIPPACFGQNVSSWRDAARRVGMNEVLFRANYTRVGSGDVRVSLDAEGKAVFLGRPAGATESTALVPNPIGFFYDAPKLWVDSLSYYQQTEVKRPTYYYPPRPFTDSTAIEMYANAATVGTAKLGISMAEDFILPTLELDLTWSLQGDAPGRNPFSSTTPRLDATIPTLTDRGLGATVEITRKSLYDARGSAPWVSRADSMVVGTVQGLKFGEGVPTGKTDRVLAEFSPALRTRMLTVGGTGWMGSTTEKFTELKVRVCLDMNGMTRDTADDKPALTASRGGINYSAGFMPQRRCVVAPQTVLLERDMTIKPVSIPRSGQSSSQVGKSVNQGDSTVATANDFGGQNSCQKQCTVNADCGAGQSCQRSNGATAGLGLCTGTAASGSACTNLSREDMGSGGTGGRSQFSMTTEAGSSRDPNGAANAEADVNAEVLSFDVLDAFGEGEEEEEKPYSVGWQKFSISIVPNFDIVENAIKGDQLLQKPIKPVGKAYHMPDFEGVEREGLSVGIALELQLWIGPLPVIASFSASVALGFGLNLEVELNKESEGQSNSPLYPCFGTNRCVKPVLTLKDFRGAARECSIMGGRLADARSDAALEAVKTAAETAMRSTGKGAAWLGGQLGFEYTLPECWQYYRPGGGTPPSSCLNTAKTKYMWVADGQSFAEQTGYQPTAITAPTSSPLLGANRFPFSTLVTTLPKMGGLAFTGYAPNPTSVRVSDATNQLPFVCEFEPAKSYDAVKVGVTASVEASAGFGFEVCTPNSAFGLCLGAGVKLIFAEVALSYSFTDNDVFRQNGTLMRNVMVHEVAGAWKWGFLAGNVTAALKLLFFTLEWEIAKYEGLQATADQVAKGLGSDVFDGKFGAPLFKESLTLTRNVP